MSVQSLRIQYNCCFKRILEYNCCLKTMMLHGVMSVSANCVWIFTGFFFQNFQILSLALQGGLSGSLEAMPFSTQPETGKEQNVLVATLDNVKNLSNILKAIHFKDHATCFATSNGLKVTVENAKSLQANAFIQVRPLDFFSADLRGILV